MIVLLRRLCEQRLLRRLQLLLRHATLLHLRRPLLPRLELLFLLARNRQHLLDILGKAQLLQRRGDMFWRDGLLALALHGVVGFGGDHGDELNAAVDEDVARFFGHGFAGGEDFGSNFTDGCFGEC